MPADDGARDARAADAWLEPDAATRDLAPALASYRARGFGVVPGAVSAAGLEALRARAGAIMDGAVDHTPFFFQQDAPSGRYDDMPLGQGWVGPSRTYRKIEKLERDDVFRAWIGNALFERIARAVLGDGAVTLYRAILMNKPAADGARAGGTDLPWHQDGGQLWGLSEEPELQLWTALDDAPLDAGCMSFAAGTHHEGLATALGGAVPRELAAARTLDVVPVPARAGDVVVLHNLVWHASGLNHTAHARRAFSVCLMRGGTRCLRTRRAARHFPEVFARR